VPVEVAEEAIKTLLHREVLEHPVVETVVQTELQTRQAQ
jgi:cation transport regulator ChaC